MHNSTIMIILSSGYHHCLAGYSLQIYFMLFMVLLMLTSQTFQYGCSHTQNTNFSCPLQWTQATQYNHRGHAVAFVIWNETSTITSHCARTGLHFRTVRTRRGQRCVWLKCVSMTRWKWKRAVACMLMRPHYLCHSRVTKINGQISAAHSLRAVHDIPAPPSFLC